MWTLALPEEMLPCLSVRTLVDLCSKGGTLGLTMVGARSSGVQGARSCQDKLSRGGPVSAKVSTLASQCEESCATLTL